MRVARGIDHLVIGASELAAGQHYVEGMLGVRLSPGGKHPQMGTHNCLLGLGPHTYLEVIAIDPQAPVPDRPRWFGLGRPETAQRLADGPQLLAWVVHGVNVQALPRGLRNRLGPFNAMHRGDLEWRVTLPATGQSPHGGLLPALIEWGVGVHPARRLPDRGCRLEALHLAHPEPEAVGQSLAQLGISDLVTAVSPASLPSLTALIRTPEGLRRLPGSGC